MIDLCVQRLLTKSRIKKISDCGGDSEETKKLYKWAVDCINSALKTKNFESLHYAEVYGKIIKYGKSPALELGCGSGKNSIILSKHSNISDLILLDFSFETLSTAKKIFSDFNTSGNFIVGDMEYLPLKRSTVPFIHSDCSLEHLKGYEKAIRAMFRVLQENGMR